MFCKTSSTFFLIFSFFIVALFSHNIQKEKLLLENLNAAHKVMVYAPEAIKGYEEGKLYLNENRIFQTDSGPSLSLYNGEVLPISFTPRDSIGPYLITMAMVNEKKRKFFKCVCKNGHEWVGGLFDVVCPVCRTPDWWIEWDPECGEEFEE